MPYRMIQPASAKWILEAETALSGAAGTSPSAADADRAEAALRTDFGRISRWLWGLLGTAGAAVAGAIGGFAAVAFHDAATDPAAIAFGLGALVIALAFGIPSVWLLLVLHRTGKRLARATAYWAALPYKLGVRVPTAGDGHVVRYAVYSPDLFLRVTTSALAFLAAVFSGSLVFFGTVVQPSPAGTAIGIAWTILAASVMIGQFGGVQRIQNGYVWRSPHGYERRMRRLGR